MVCMVWYGMVLYGMVWCCMVWYGVAWYGMVFLCLVGIAGIIQAENESLSFLGLRSGLQLWKRISFILGAALRAAALKTKLFGFRSCIFNKIKCWSEVSASIRLYMCKWFYWCRDNPESLFKAAESAHTQSGVLKKDRVGFGQRCSERTLQNQLDPFSGVHG